MSKKVLVVDDEHKIRELVKLYLDKEGFSVTCAVDGAAALEAWEKDTPDLIVLDLLLPKVSGLDVCRQIRQSSSVPIIMLTAKTEEVDKLIGLELGADDYVTKPFSPRELVARIRAVLRRAEVPQKKEMEELSVGELTLSFARHEASVDGEVVNLTPTEFQLLTIFMSNPGRVFSRLQLVDHVQGYAFEGYERTMDAHIKNLRRKIEADPSKPRYIQTVYGVGYKLEVV